MLVTLTEIMQLAIVMSARLKVSGNHFLSILPAWQGTCSGNMATFSPVAIARPRRMAIPSTLIPLIGLVSSLTISKLSMLSTDNQATCI